MSEKYRINIGNSWLNPDESNICDLESALSAAVSIDHLGWAEEIQKQIVIYDANKIRQRLNSDTNEPQTRNLLSEWNWVWEHGPGVMVIKNAFLDHSLLDEVNGVFNDIIEQEKTQSHGDHFAAGGANARIWNALEKLCLHSPELFVRYYANDMVDFVSHAWMGPGYQVTSQVNCVYPGGKAQSAHRDYHLGFMSANQAAGYPLHAHRLTPALTLQGAIAQVDMPLESGPTLFLPHSQKFMNGYLVANKPEFQEYFNTHHVQLPLSKGDAVFFNPALLHAAGNNVSDGIQRIANLLQISSAFGRAMESVDRTKMSIQAYPAFRDAKQKKVLSDIEIGYAIAACAEGYAFPTNLDKDPPLSGLAPPSQADTLRQALSENWTVDKFKQHLHEWDQRRRSA